MILFLYNSGEEFLFSNWRKSKIYGICVDRQHGNYFIYGKVVDRQILVESPNLFILKPVITQLKGPRSHAKGYVQNL
jgi:hypothetical protein